MCITLNEVFDDDLNDGVELHDFDTEDSFMEDSIVTSAIEKRDVIADYIVNTCWCQ